MEIIFLLALMGLFVWKFAGAFAAEDTQEELDLKRAHRRWAKMAKDKLEKEKRRKGSAEPNGDDSVKARLDW